ncbi:hypothetical protein Hena1_00270 [Erwinia phage Hena1]|jgi:hypothetical protein|uniref:Uncharacterized protein n=1 Tax=Erwinia phage Hena1 TaxID=2678601 RepID=A0A6B9J9E9_9CAUD|nr:hypothetical protein HWC84_gp026 [Erwinia phage Hena1]QGZ16203.1 hypothetical protein Hena1_00270 [Erwinia phage Hena1]
MVKNFVDSAGNLLNVGDHVMLYFGYNELKPGVIDQVRNLKAKVMVTTNPGREPTLSIWKYGSCMIKVPDPARPYPPEVYGLLDEVRRIRDEECINADGMPVKRTCQRIINFWEMKRPMSLVTSQGREYV